MRISQISTTVIEITKIPRNYFQIIRSFAVVYAQEIQDQMAELFDNEETADGPLIPAENEAYIQRKMEEVGHNIPGVYTGSLQRAIHTQRLYSIRGNSDRLTVTFDLGRLNRGRAADYAQHYSDRNTENGLLSISDDMFDNFRAQLLEELPFEERFNQFELKTREQTRRSQSFRF